MNRALIHRRAQRALPDSIETSGLLHFGTSPGQVEGVLLGSVFDCGAQGVVVLRLAGQTAVAIQRQGLAFFEQAHVARAGLQQAVPAHYGQWQRMLLGAKEGISAEAAFSSEVIADWNGAAYFAGSLDRRAWLAVLPVERLVVYGWLN
ncbi:hypothetical protein [Stenotrophomonas sp. Iso1]|uniref:hypothetical protein n=1 Tax=Stenotrophomonas sp. Iso1 TaxID=2977283 RepID=UPI0022B7B5F7|nr:hypothetical protein [Stenotrophomonas sp. Iso1]